MNFLRRMAAGWKRETDVMRAKNDLIECFANGTVPTIEDLTVYEEAFPMAVTCIVKHTGIVGGTIFSDYYATKCPQLVQKLYP